MTNPTDTGLTVEEVEAFREACGIVFVGKDYRASMEAIVNAARSYVEQQAKVGLSTEDCFRIALESQMAKPLPDHAGIVERIEKWLSEGYGGIHADRLVLCRTALEASERHVSTYMKLATSHLNDYHAKAADNAALRTRVSELEGALRMAKLTDQTATDDLCQRLRDPHRRLVRSDREEAAIRIEHLEMSLMEYGVFHPGRAALENENVK